MKRTWTIIGVADVGRSFSWYQSLFGQPRTAPAHDYFGQIVDTDGTVLLCLHKWGAHEHPTLVGPDRAEPGNGLLLFFRVDDFTRKSSCQSTGERAPDESCHRDARVRAARLGRLLRYGQRVVVSENDRIHSNAALFQDAA